MIDTLANAGRSGEIGQQYEAGLRSLREVGGGSGPLLRAWRAAQAAAGHSGRAEHRPHPSTAHPIPVIEPTDAAHLSIVVLPFINLGNDPEQQYFADGITGDLTTDLSRIPDMLVISRNTAFTYRNKPVDTKQIGRELGVRYLLGGEVQRLGSRVRVTAQLIDAETDAHLWAERFAGDAGDLFALQDEITNRIAVALDLELVERRRRPADRASGHAGLHFAGTRRAVEAAVARKPRRSDRAVRAGVGARSRLGRRAGLVGDRADCPCPRFDGRRGRG